jgi:hypothetical protein
MEWVQSLVELTVDRSHMRLAAPLVEAVLNRIPGYSVVYLGLAKIDARLIVRLHKTYPPHHVPERNYLCRSPI